MNYKKYLIGFLVFFGYYLLSRNIENKIAAVRKLTNVGTPAE
jgi:hypothetical protein